MSQIHETPDQPVIDFHGTKVTPGHVYACPDGEYRQLGAIMMGDGYVVDADGGIVRARTAEAVSPESFALRQAMFGSSGVPAFEGAFDLAGADPESDSDADQDSFLPGAVEIPSMAPDILAGAIGGAFASPAHC